MPAESKRCRSRCPIANALEIVGDRWTLLLMRDLLFRNLHEFKEFLESPEGIATNILSARLKLLTDEGLVEHIPHPTNKTKKLYYLTEKGKSLMPLLIEMTLWGSDQIAGTAAPPQIVERMRKQRRAFEGNILKTLADWEVKYLKTGS